MRFSVPQFIDIEDKIAFQLTAKQLGWFAGGGFILFLLWSFLSFAVFVVVGLVVIVTSVSLAFIRINNVSLLEYFQQGTSFFFKPKVFVWRKTLSSMEELTQSNIPKKKIIGEKRARSKNGRMKDLDKIVNILNSQ